MSNLNLLVSWRGMHEEEYDYVVNFINHIEASGFGIGIKFNL